MKRSLIRLGLVLFEGRVVELGLRLHRFDVVILQLSLGRPPGAHPVPVEASQAGQVDHGEQVDGVRVLVRLRLRLRLRLAAAAVVGVGSRGRAAVGASDDESAEVVVVEGEVIAGDVGAGGEVAVRGEAQRGQLDDLVVDAVPAVEVHQHCHWPALALLHLHHCPLAPDALRVPHVHLQPRPQPTHLHLTLPPPLLEPAQAISVSGESRRAWRRCGSCDEGVEYCAGDELCALDALAAVGAVVGEDEALVQALVAERVAAHRQHWPHQRLQADRTPQLLLPALHCQRPQVRAQAYISSSLRLPRRVTAAGLGLGLERRVSLAMMAGMAVRRQLRQALALRYLAMGLRRVGVGALRWAWQAASRSCFSAGVSLRAGEVPADGLGRHAAEPRQQVALAHQYNTRPPLAISHPNHPYPTPYITHRYRRPYLPLYRHMDPSLPFEPAEDGLYKIASALDQTKCFTVHSSGALLIDTYTAAPSQKFNIFTNDNKFALVSQQDNRAVFVAQDSPQDGARAQADPAQHKSSFFDLQTVTSGPFAGNGCYLKTFCGKALDVFEGKTAPGTPVIQWAYHGHNNQVWLISPSTAQQQQPKQQPQFQIATKNTFPEVPAAFLPTNTQYKLLSALNTSKALTVAHDRSLRINDYSGDASQRFTIVQEGGKFAFVVSSLQEGLSVAKESKENGAKVVADAGKHGSSWFEVVRASSGEWQNRAYKIKTFAQRALDLSEGNVANGTPVVQWSEHNDFNQVWLIVPADQALPKYESKTTSNSLFGINLPNVNIPFPKLNQFTFPQ